MQMDPHRMVKKASTHYVDIVFQYSEGALTAPTPRGGAEEREGVGVSGLLIWPLLVGKQLPHLLLPLVPVAPPTPPHSRGGGTAWPLRWPRHRIKSGQRAPEMGAWDRCQRTGTTRSQPEHRTEIRFCLIAALAVRGNSSSRFSVGPSVTRWAIHSGRSVRPSPTPRAAEQALPDTRARRGIDGLHASSLERVGEEGLIRLSR